MLASILNLLVGSVKIPFADVCDILVHQDHANKGWVNILLSSRLPRTITAIFAGAGLATSGLLLQTVFRNPLAGPSILGISAGASLGVALALMLNLNFLFGSTTILAGILGSAATLAIIVFLSHFIRNYISILIIGVMIGYLVSSTINVLELSTTKESLQKFVFWNFGSFNRVRGTNLWLLVGTVCIGLTLSALLIKPLNALLLSDQSAKSLGINLKSSKRLIIIAAGILVGATTAFCGPIAFIGLAVPHICRNIIRSSLHQQLLPLVIFSGAFLALICDLIAILPWSEQSLPLNTVTALIGAPVVVIILFKHQKIRLR